MYWDYYYCQKCGWVIPRKEENCSYCNNKMLPIPEKYISKSELLTDKEVKNRAVIIREELVKTSSEFNQELFDHLEEFETQLKAKSDASWARISPIFHANMSGNPSASSNIPKCPTCQSTKIRKIGGIERGVSVWTFGLMSKKINKTFKCENCSYTW